MNNDNTSIQRDLWPIHSKVVKELGDVTLNRGPFNSFGEFAEVMLQVLEGILDLPASGAACKVILEALDDGLIDNAINDINDDFHEKLGADDYDLTSSKRRKIVPVPAPPAPIMQ